MIEDEKDKMIKTSIDCIRETNDLTRVSVDSNLLTSCKRRRANPKGAPADASKKSAS